MNAKSKTGSSLHALYVLLLNTYFIVESQSLS